jgi:hypothetical protein
LNGKDVTAAPANIRQSDVTAVSLLLATGFRTAITSSIGISVTQYLWRLFRLKAFDIRLVEDLFQIRSNIFGLTNHKIVRHTPFIFIAVLITWLVPVATIYPPSALTIQIESRWNLQTINASVVNPTPKEGEGYFDSREGWRANPVMNNTVYYGCVSTLPCPTKQLSGNRGPEQALERLTRSVRTTGRVAPVRPIMSENSSYQVQFEGPIVYCQDDTVTNVTLPVEDHYTTPTATSFMIDFDPNPNDPRLGITRNNLRGQYLHAEYPANFQSVKGFPHNITKSAIAEQHRMNCSLGTALYTVKLRYNRGAQIVSFSKSDEKRFNFSSPRSLLWSEDESQAFANTTLDRSSQEFRDWEMSLSEWRHKANSLGPFVCLFRNYGITPRKTHRQQ